MATDRQYTGQRRESGLGLYDYNARYYDPALGRFIQADSIVPEPGNPQALNRYAYTLNNPMRYTDPTGHYSCGDYYDTGCFESFDEREAYVEMSGDEEIWGYRYMPRRPDRPTKKLTTIGMVMDAGVDTNAVVGFGVSTSATYTFNFMSGELGIIRGVEFHTSMGLTPGAGVSGGAGVFLGYNGSEFGDFAGRDYATELEIEFGELAGEIGGSGSRSYSLVPGSMTQYQTDRRTGGIIQSETYELQVSLGPSITLFPVQRNVSPGTNNASTTAVVLYPWNWGEHGFITHTPMDK